jgi:hypothetical protein
MQLHSNSFGSQLSFYLKDDGSELSQTDSLEVDSGAITLNAPNTVYVSTAPNTVRIFPTLTSVFTLSSSCFTNVYLDLSGFEVFPTFNRECYPSSNTAGTFSPGICPYQFNIVNATVTVTSYPSGNLTVTTATCCPGAPGKFSSEFTYMRADSLRQLSSRLFSITSTLDPDSNSTLTLCKGHATESIVLETSAEVVVRKGS